MTKHHLKKRIDIVVATPLLRMIDSTLDPVRAPGYSVLPVEGRGSHNARHSQGQIGDAINMMAVLCIVDPAHANEVMTPFLPPYRIASVRHLVRRVRALA